MGVELRKRKKRATKTGGHSLGKARALPKKRVGGGGGGVGFFLPEDDDDDEQQQQPWRGTKKKRTCVSMILLSRFFSSFRGVSFPNFVDSCYMCRADHKRRVSKRRRE